MGFRGRAGEKKAGREEGRRRCPEGKKEMRTVGTYPQKNMGGNAIKNEEGKNSRKQTRACVSWFFSSII